MVPSTAIFLVAFLGVFHVAPPWSADYGKALSAARDQGRPLVVVLENPSDTQGLAGELCQIPAELLAQFQICRVDATSSYGRKVAKLYGAREYPYVVITDARCREVLFRGVGNLAHGTLTESLAAHAPRQWPPETPQDSPSLQEIRAFAHEDLQAAQTAAIKSKRPILVAVSMDACHFCDKLEEETFSDQQLREKIARQFESVMIKDADHADWVNAHEVSIFPTILVVDSNDRLLDRVEGFVRPRQLESRLDQISAQRLSRR